MKRNEYVTADLHFGHRGILGKDDREFANIDEMDHALITAWNKKVPQHGAIVYVLGDVSFRSADDTRIILGQLHGSIRIVRGNHDRKHNRRVLEERAEWVRDYYESKTETGVKVCMFHYPMLTWNCCHYGSWHLHGHSHGNLTVITGRRLDVGVDCNVDFAPFSFDEIEAGMFHKKYVQVDHHTESERA